MSEKLLDLIEQAFSSVDELYSSLSPGEWDLPTDCPGWTVRDQLSHLIGVESWFAGRPRATVEVSGDHIKNPLGEANEREVVARRGRAPDQMREEWREVTGERLKQLAAMAPEDWARETDTPLGPGKVRDLMAIRVVDMTYHEQDVRRATGRPGALNGGCARHTFERMTMALPMIVAKRGQAPDGATAVFEVGPPGRAVGVAVAGGRGAFTEAPPQSPAMRLAMDLETFLCLCGGRWTAERALSEGRVSIGGDRELGERILAGMSVMF